jgi:hypothetical protein
VGGRGGVGYEVGERGGTQRQTDKDSDLRLVDLNYRLHGSL